MSELLVQPPSVDTIYGLDEISDTVQATLIPHRTSSVSCQKVGAQSSAGTVISALGLSPVCSACRSASHMTLQSSAAMCTPARTGRLLRSKLA